MRRALVARILALLVVLAAVAAGSASAAISPTSVPRRFVAAAERADGRGACEHLTSRLREHLALMRVLLQEDVYTRDAWSAEGTSRGCDRVVATFARLTGRRGAGGRRVVLDRVRVVARRGGVVQLRLRRQAADRRAAAPAAQSIDVFLVREGGRWRIALPGRLIVFDDDGPGGPRTFTGFDRYQRVLARVVRERRVRIDRAIAARERARTPLAPMAPACAGPVSEIADPAGDALDRELRPAGAGGLASAIDVAGATLQGGAGELCLTVRFAGPAPASAGVALEVRQPDGGIDARETGGSGGTLHAEIENGHVTGWAEPFTFFAGVHATVVGDAVHVRFPASAAEDAINRPVEPFLWIATVTADTGLPRPDWLPSDRTDLVGAGTNGSFGGPGGGVRHPRG